MTGPIRPLPPVHRGPRKLPWSIGQLSAPRLVTLAERLGLAIERFEGDGLGPTIACGAVLPSQDVDVLQFFRETGPRYRSRMNAVLRSYMERTVASAPKRSKKRGIA